MSDNDENNVWEIASYKIVILRESHYLMWIAVLL